jgi:hypothetical protein
MHYDQIAFVRVVTARLDRVHTVRVDCALGRRVARETALHAHQRTSRHWTFNRHGFRCDGCVVSEQTVGVGTTLRWRCDRHEGRQRVRFREIVID